MKPRPTPLVRFLITASALGLLAACDRTPDPGIAEKVALLEAELRDRDAQLAALQEEQEAKSSIDSSSSAPDLDLARGAYLGFVDSLKSKLAAALPGAKFERTSVFPIEGPDPAKPIFSRVAFRIIREDGRSGEMLIPLSANAAGAWQEPVTAEIVANFKSKLTATPEPAKTPVATVSTPPTRTQPTDVMGANRTVEVQWADSPKPAAPATSPPSNAQPPPAAPNPPPAVPKKVMPTTRDVIIDFDDP